MLVGVRFKAKEREHLFTQVTDWHNSLPADAEDAISPPDFREDEISPQKKDLNWVITQTNHRLRKLPDVKIIESLRWEKASKIIKSNL